jgi:glycosyltransferase involved in cell wall biosynthesis
MAGLRHYEERGYPRQALRYVPNGIDCERFSFTMKGREMVRRDLGIPLDSRVIGLFARVDPKKDHTTFLSAAERLHRDEPDVHFLCAGGVNKENLERYSCLLRKTKSLGLGGVVHWIGVQAAPELCMSGCDITTLTSAFGEGFPNVVAESMACEVPCVSTEVGDASIIIGDNGVVVRRSDPEALSEAWRKLLALTDDDRRALGRKARESIVDRFSVRQAAESTLDVLSGRDEVATSA